MGDIQLSVEASIDAIVLFNTSLIDISSSERLELGCEFLDGRVAICV
jgi:hypothetical protein